MFVVIVIVILFYDDAKPLYRDRSPLSVCCFGFRTKMIFAKGIFKLARFACSARIKTFRVNFFV